MTRWPAPEADRSAPPLRFNLQELSGALGDVGVLVPIIAALIAKNGFNATSVLLVFGLTYVAAGLYYRLPVPVQPLKAMAAIAIAQGLSPETVSTAGLIMGVLLLLLAGTGLISPLASLFSRPVIRGIQVAVGLLLLRAGLRLCLDSRIVPDGPEVLWQAGGAELPAGLLVAAALLPVLALTFLRPRLPVVALVLPPALLLGVLATPGAAVSGLQLGPDMPAVRLPGGDQLLTALVLLVIPQLPLTLGNAVIACRDTARGYFHEAASRVTHRSLLTTKGLANLFAGLIGGMPVCHGSGGLSAHYRFGARTGGATVMLGGILLVLALGFGSGAQSILALIPLPVLGVMLVTVGAQHALLARDVRAGREWLVVATIAGMALITGNVAAGFAGGIVLDRVLGLPRLYVRLRRRGPAAVPDVLGGQAVR